MVRGSEGTGLRKDRSPCAWRPGQVLLSQGPWAQGPSIRQAELKLLGSFVLRVHKKAFGDRSATTRFEASTVLAVSDPPCPAGVPGGWLGSSVWPCHSSQSVPTVSFVTWQRQSRTQGSPMALVSVFMHLRW